MQLRGLLGIADNPVNSINIYAQVKNVRNNSNVGNRIDLGAVTSTQNPSYASNAVSLAERTPYAILMYTGFSGHGEDNPFAVQCFMTGGSYTIPNGGNEWMDIMRSAVTDCTMQGQLGSDSEIRTKAEANLPWSENDYPGRNINGAPTWESLVQEEIKAIKFTFDPGKCRAPDANQPRTNGCYSISPRTQLDVRNCLCGRSPRPAGLTGCR